MTANEIVVSAWELVLRRKALLLLGLLVAVSVRFTYPLTIDIQRPKTAVVWRGPATSSISFALPALWLRIAPTHNGQKLWEPSVAKLRKKIGPFEIRLQQELDEMKMEAKPTNKEISKLSTFLFLLVLLTPAVIALSLIASISQAALIDGVKHVVNETPFSLWASLRVGLAFFGKVLGLGVGFGFLSIFSMMVVAAPLLFETWGGIPTWLFSAVLGLLAIPWLLTLSFMQQYATRIAVLDGEGIFTAVRKAKLFLHGRLKISLKLYLWEAVWQIILFPLALFLGQLAIFVLALPVSVVHTFVGGSALMNSMLSLAFIVIVSVVVAFFGAFRSAIWTCAFLRLRAAG